MSAKVRIAVIAGTPTSHFDVPGDEASLCTRILAVSACSKNLLSRLFALRFRRRSAVCVERPFFVRTQQTAAVSAQLLVRPVSAAVMSPKLRQQIPSSISFFRSLEIVCCAFSAIGCIWFWRAQRRRNFDAIARPRDARGWAVAVAFGVASTLATLRGSPPWRSSGHAWSASRGSHRAPLRSTDIPLAFVCPSLSRYSRTCDVAALCASTADTCAGCAPGVRTCCCWPFSVRRCLRLQRTPPSAIPLSICSSSVSCACHGVHRSRRWLGGSCHGGRTRLPSQLD